MKSNLPRGRCSTRKAVAHLTSGLLLTLAALAQDAEKPEDLLRFRNGDSLHGSFLGLAGGDLPMAPR